LKKSIQYYRASSLRKAIMDECNDGKGGNGKAHDKKATADCGECM
jgi:hypothetical protein